ncbi:MAG: NADH:flavin oxidoreductase/NADH oxidase family protein [Gammaproteobacteria bacterium]
MTIDICSPYTLPCGTRLRNRIMKAAMTEGLADAHGHVTEPLVTLYRRWSHGGAAIHVTGNVMIDAQYLERPGNLVVHKNTPLDGLKRLAAAGTEGGNELWMQISHPGRQCSRIVNMQPVSASDVQLRILGNFARPRALTAEEIPGIITRYAETAEQAARAGFSGVQIHAAHGYLISQFLSPVTNRRHDEWGGSLANRARFLLDTVRATRARVGASFPIAVKLNSADFQRGGFSPDDSLQVATWLEQENIDLLEVSGGTYEQPRLVGRTGSTKTLDLPKAQSTRQREAYFLDYAQKMREALTLPLAVTGGFRSRAFMDDALRNGELDVIGVARPLCAQPDIIQSFLDGGAAPLPSDEHGQTLGPGWLGPASPFNSVRAFNTQGAVAWFYRQMIEIAHDRPALRNLSTFGALWRHLRDEYRMGFARRRQLRGSSD